MVRTVVALIRKEFHQVVRDRTMLRLILIMPIVQLLVLGYTVTTEVKQIRTALYDFDRSPQSRDFLRSMTAGEYFVPAEPEPDLLDVERGFRRSRYDAALIIPNDFSERLIGMESVEVGLLLDGSNANSASISIGYAGMITARFNERTLGADAFIGLHRQMLYNPDEESRNFMVPGIVATLLTMITIMLTAMAIVREKEIGTLEQLMVTPIATSALILGKTIPFVLLGFLEMSIALAFGIVWFHIPFAGSWGLLYALSFLYLFTTLGIGMFISTISGTQQQAMFLAWFFSLFAILTSGFFTPIANMPEAVRVATYINPLRYFITIVRGIIMKGASIDVLYHEVIALAIYGAAIFSFSWMRFSKRIR
jgi:ABC-2 type transport system permease protein